VKDFERYKVLVLPDHATPISVRTHTADPVPYVIYSSEDGPKQLRTEGFDEVSAGQSAIFIENGFELIERFLNPHRFC
jgi:2,3-bisphosphoglycerate-independent phosphoglycerate mutase